MFETSKLPTEQRTVTGNSVSFNTHYALPLDACKVRVNITQSGSGTPTLLNRRPFINISSLGITHNSILSNVPLGSDYYDFELDLNTGILTSYWYVFRADEYGWRETNTVFYCTEPSAIYRPEYIKKTGILNIKSDVYDTNDTNDLSVFGNLYNKTYYIRDMQYLGNIKDFKAHLTSDNVMLAFELATPITIQLTPTELSSILGNNTFSTDTGSLEISFQDLQEKSASGSVATFNTALAMPLSSCNIAVNAWQEGSGDPSPVNNRPIHGFSEVNPTRQGKNLLNKDNFIILYTPYSEMTFSKATFLKKGTYTISLSNVVNSTRWRYAFRLFDKNGNIFTNAITNGKVSFSLTLSDIYDNNTACVSTSNIYDTSCVITIYEDCYITCGLCFGNVSPDTTCNVQLEAGSTATAYEPYVTPTIYTKQLGETVYGGSYNSVSGVKKKDIDLIALGSISWNVYGSYSEGMRLITTVFDSIDNSVLYAQKCNCFPFLSAIPTNGSGLRFGSGSSKTSLFIDYDDVPIDYERNRTGILQWLTDINANMTLPITPIESNIGSMPISTLIGNNTIFADTGDVDLTYKDCDLAKRGDFRQVFEIPD